MTFKQYISTVVTSNSQSKIWEALNVTRLSLLVFFAVFLLNFFSLVFSIVFVFCKWLLRWANIYYMTMCLAASTLGVQRMCYYCSPRIESWFCCRFALSALCLNRFVMFFFRSPFLSFSFAHFEIFLHAHVCIIKQSLSAIIRSFFSRSHIILSNRVRLTAPLSDYSFIFALNLLLTIKLFFFLQFNLRVDNY